MELKTSKLRSNSAIDHLHPSSVTRCDAICSTPKCRAPMVIAECRRRNFGAITQSIAFPHVSTLSVKLPEGSTAVPSRIGVPVASLST